MHRYNLVFVGTSFSDKPLREMLKKYKGPRQHFAIVTSDTATSVSNLGICPVEVGSFSEIAGKLKQVHCAALNPEVCKEVGIEDPDEYWRRLEAGPAK